MTLSLMRLWNYNKSRIHSFRGARHLEVRLDQVLVFRGEINKAPGNVADAEACAEILLFTVEDQILARIEQHDAEQQTTSCDLPKLPSRPSTARRDEGCHEAAPPLEHSAQTMRRRVAGRGGGVLDCRPSLAQVPAEVLFAPQRPSTAACQQPTPVLPSYKPSLPPVQDYETALHPRGRVLKLMLTSTWGDAHYIGLNGLELLDSDGKLICAPPGAVTADPYSISILPGMAGDPRTPDKLVDGVNATFDDRHMWLAPHTPGTTCMITLTLPRMVALGAIRMWNYAKTTERGVKGFSILFDDAIIFEGFMRAAPPRATPSPPSGAADEDFVQTVIFTDNEQLIDAEADHIYNQEQLDDELVFVDNGHLLSGNRPRLDTLRPTTAAHGFGSSGSLSRPPAACSLAR
uniref:KATNIP domain-containing protein n=1 Tax=Calcidiscus leptoporus TaxID=127549 RepID=A0A7S0P615_9EUKA|mmetsp:Transcript_7732/g.18057  ORF Transcript_7732/g.18057 Transcript_7732/m.18057 type:complete len:404 (+) Transcript_7732:175-1386(+)